MAETVRRLITARGRLLRSNGRLLATPLLMVPAKAVQDTATAGDRILAAGTADAVLAEAVTAGDFVTRNPPPATQPDAVTAGSTLSLGLVMRPGRSDTVTAGATVTGVVESRANTGPLPRITWTSTPFPPSYDSNGWAYIDIPAGSEEYTWVGVMQYQPVGAETVENLALLDNPGSTFNADWLTLMVGMGHVIGPPGTVYDVSMLWQTTIGDFERNVRITAV